MVQSKTQTRPNFQQAFSHPERAARGQFGELEMTKHYFGVRLLGQLCRFTKQFDGDEF
jgi:hypothetical protein